MAITVDWGNTWCIQIPQADLTLVSGTLYTLDTNWFWEQLKDIEDSEEGIVFPDTHIRFAAYTIAGVTYVPALQIIPPYCVEFEDGQYSVRLEGTNNNIFDIQNGILVQNNVQVIPTNSAGLIQTTVIQQVPALDPADQTKLDEIHRIHGLKSGENLVVSDTSRQSGSLTQTIATGATQTVVSRT